MTSFLEKLTGSHIKEEGGTQKEPKNTPSEEFAKIKKDNSGEEAPRASLAMAQKKSSPDSKPTTRKSEGQLTLDIYEKPDSFVVKSTIAGIQPENIDVSVTNESVTIRGERKEEEKVSEKNYIYREIYWGSFSRSVQLPEEVNPDEAKASMSKNGILKVIIPKLKQSQSEKKLKVEKG